MVLRQCVNDFDVKKVIATIGGIGCTMIELDIVPQFYLKRTFCILETYATVVGKAKMLMTVNLVRAMRMREELQKEPVKAEESKCWSEEEERRIKGFIREQVEGGIKGFNKLVTAKMIEGADEVVRAARESSTLDLSNCELDSERGDGEVLAQIVSGFGALKTLNVASNPKLGFKGGAALASGLAGSGLISLNIANNFLGAHDDEQQNRWVATPEVFAALAEAFTKMPQLTSVNIAGNWIGVEGGMKLAEALLKMPNLREVNLADNYLTSGGGDMSAVITLAEAFTKMPNLREVNIVDNSLNQKAEQALKSAVAGMDVKIDF